MNVLFLIFKYVIKFIRVVHYLSVPVLAISFLFTRDHIAVYNISMAAFLIGGFTLMFVDKVKPDKKLIYVYLPFIGLFLVYAIGCYIHYFEWDFYKEFVRNKIKYILFPLGFVFIRPRSFLQYNISFLIYNIGVLGIAFYSLNNFYTNFVGNDDLRELLKLGIPSDAMPYDFLNHTISFFILLAIVMLVEILWFQKRDLNKIIKWLSVVLLIVDVVILHMFISRAILPVFYLIVGYLVLSYVYKSEQLKLKVKLLLVGGFFIFIFGNITLNPFIVDRIKKTQEAVQTFDGNKNVGHNNLNFRVVSAKWALRVLDQHFWKGISYHDMERFYWEFFDKEINVKGGMPMYPHTQFLYIAVALGVPLALVFFICLYMPLGLGGNYKSFLITSYYFIWTAYFISETPLHLSRECLRGFMYLTPLIIHYYYSKKQLHAKYHL